MRTLALLAALALTGSLVADDKKEKVKDEEAILGTWKMEKLDLGGPKGPPAEEIGKVRWTFKSGGKAVMTNPDGKEQEGSYKLDPSAKVKTIDLVQGGQTAPAVYKLDGDTLTVCMAPPGKTRPTEFKADGNGVFVYTLKRVKEEKKDK